MNPADLVKYFSDDYSEGFLNNVLIGSLYVLMKHELFFAEFSALNKVLLSLNQS